MSIQNEKQTAHAKVEPTSTTTSRPARAQDLPDHLADILDDYDLVQHQDWMSAPGGFR